MKKRGIIFLLVVANLVNFGVTRAEIEQNVEARRAQLQAELEAEERAIAEQTKKLAAKQKESASYQGEVALLKSQIAQAQTRIKAKKLAIAKLGLEISARQGKIETLSEKIKKEQTSLAELLRQTREVDLTTLPEIVLDNSRLSDFFSNVDSFESVQKAINQSVAEIRNSQANLKQEQSALTEKQNQELDAQKEIEYQQKLVQNRETEKSKLLSVTKTQELEYQKILTERQKRAAAIRSALFALRDTAAIPFGKALEYAVTASKQTGVRPAFVLAILQQESNLGENIGTCNRAGDPPEKSWRQIMKPSRDQGPYLQITSGLGLNPDTMPLSCPWQGGWGGAMGPSQFIPSTWLLYLSRLKSLLGHLPNPWEASDAFMASSLFLSDLGASAGTYSAERNAACRYYSGRSCDAKKPANAFYGDQVMTRAVNIQLNMIDPLED